MITPIYIMSYINALDEFIFQTINSNDFTLPLVATPVGRYITESILVCSILLLTYESIYWSGIYLGLWEYHAKDIFKEIPVHCAHVYIRLNVAQKKNLPKIEQYYELLKNSKLNLLNYKAMNDIKKQAFDLKDFVKYHFEFSPEDFEKNKKPEYGSTIDHLRLKTFNLFNSSDLYKPFKNEFLSKGNVFIYNKYGEKIGRDEDFDYLVKCGIETGDTIDCIIVCS